MVWLVGLGMGLEGPSAGRWWKNVGKEEEVAGLVVVEVGRGCGVAVQDRRDGVKACRRT